MDALMKGLYKAIGNTTDSAGDIIFAYYSIFGKVQFYLKNGCAIIFPGLADVLGFKYKAFPIT